MKTKFTLFFCLLLIGFVKSAQGNYLPGVDLWLKNKQINISSAYPNPIVIELFPGDTLNLYLKTYDRDSMETVQVSSDFASVVPGGTFTVNNAPRPTAYLNWVPTGADIDFIPKTITVRTEDNGVPQKCITTFQLQIRVNEPNSLTLNNIPVNLAHEIQLKPGDLFNFKLSSVRPNLLDSIKIISNVNTIIPNAVLNVNTAKQQTATINWTPTIADVRSQLYIFTLTLQENSTPAKLYTYTVKVRVSNTGGVMGTKEILSVNKSFTAYPNPFTEEVNFKFSQTTKAESILIYNLIGEKVDEIQLSNATQNEQKIEWHNAAKFPAGTYIAKLISSEKTVQTLKFIKVQ